MNIIHYQRGKIQAFSRGKFANYHILRKLRFLVWTIFACLNYMLIFVSFEFHECSPFFVEFLPFPCFGIWQVELCTLFISVCLKGVLIVIRVKPGVDLLKLLSECSFTTYQLRKQRLIGEARIQKLRDGELPTWKELDLICRSTCYQVGELIEYVPDDWTPFYLSILVWYADHDAATIRKTIVSRIVEIGKNGVLCSIWYCFLTGFYLPTFFRRFLV